MEISEFVQADKMILKFILCFTDFRFRIQAICHENRLQSRKKGYWKCFNFYISYIGLVTHEKSHTDSHKYFLSTWALFRGGVTWMAVQIRCVIRTSFVLAANFGMSFQGR